MPSPASSFLQLVTSWTMQSHMCRSQAHPLSTWHATGLKCWAILLIWVIVSLHELTPATKKQQWYANTHARMSIQTCVIQICQLFCNDDPNITNIPWYIVITHEMIMSTEMWTLQPAWLLLLILILVAVMVCLKLIEVSCVARINASSWRMCCYWC